VLAARSHPAAAFAVLLCLAGGLYVGARLALPGRRRAVMAVTDQVLDALRAGDAAGALEHVSPYFSEEGLNKRALGGLLGRALARKPISSVRVSVRQVTFAGNRASIRLYAVSTHRGAYGGPTARSEWAITFEQIRGRWLVRAARPLQLNGRRVAGLRAVLAMGY
jgi:hypothetical protein